MAGGAFVTFSARDAGLNNLVRDLKGRFQSGNQAMLEVNRESVKYLKNASTDILKNSVKREKDRRNKRGLAVVADDDAHSVSIDSFSFWVLDRVDSIDARVRSYYRAIDEGSDYWVESGRYVALIWYPGSPIRPSRGVETQAAFADRTGARVLITHPVPAYGFLSIPVSNFKSEGVYSKLVQGAFSRRGLKVKVSRTP